MQTPEDALVAVLAGGLSSRMGRSKACVKLCGTPLICYPLTAAREAGLQAVVVAKRASELPPLSVRVVDEPDTPHHPLCGIVAALRQARGPAIAVGCDMPFVGADLLLRLADGESYGEQARRQQGRRREQGRPSARTTVTRAGGRVQPLPALYRSEDLPVLERALRARNSLRETLRQLAPRVLEEDALRDLGDPARLCFSVNDMRDLREAERWMTG